MFNNLITIHDILRIFEKVKEGRFKAVLKKIFSKKKKKIADSWKHTQSPPENWENIPAVRERFNKLVTGNSSIDHRSYVKETYYQQRDNLIALSLGCGAGQNEIAWAGMGIFKRIDALDISETRIRQAIRAAAEKGVENIVKFSVSDAQNLDISDSRYDLVLFEGSLHHFSPVEDILLKINQSLKPGGYLVVFDFVGPSRFQWTRRQLEIVNGILKILPDRYKKKWYHNTLKKRVYRPGRLFMMLSEPSEAAESAKILPCLQQVFEVIELKELGGTILHLLFRGIAHNFLQDDPETRDWLQICFKLEDVVMRTKQVPSDFIFAVCKRRKVNEKGN